MERTKVTIGISFFVRKSKAKNGKYPIYMRLTVNGVRCDLAIKEWVQEKEWDEKRSRPKNSHPELKLLNTHLESLRSKMMQHYRELLLDNKVITVEMLKRKYLGLDEHAKGLLGLMAYHNEHMVGKLSEGTLKNYRSTVRYVQKFLWEKKRSREIYLADMDYRFLLEFERFVREHPLKDFDPCHNNGLMKHIERLRKIAGLGVKLGWLSKNPFESYRTNFDKFDRQYLTISELVKIEQCPLVDTTLLIARDLFVFSCYTGLAPVDLGKLSKDNLVINNDNALWIHTKREKTGTLVELPLLPKAFAVVEKYRDHPICIRKNRVFPVLTNQQLNRSLKMIGELCQIDKYLTFYISRHTFATTITLNNGVPLETVSKMLGHTKYATTQIYARILNKKISDDMAILKSKLET